MGARARRWHGSAEALAIGLLACAACVASSQRAADLAQLRQRMVEEHLRDRGIRDARVLEAMGRVPRHLFVPPEDQAAAYADHPLPIGHGQTISQPFIVAFMTEALALTASDVVLEIGTGSGYQAAILAEIVDEVYTIEIVPEIAARAERTLISLGYHNIHVRAGDGYAGWPERAPFSKIMVTAAPESVPAALVQQLADNGTMVLPLGPAGGDQELRVLRKTAQGVRTERSLPVRFVPMVRRPG